MRIPADVRMPDPTTDRETRSLNAAWLRKTMAHHDGDVVLFTLDLYAKQCDALAIGLKKDGE